MVDRTLAADRPSAYMVDMIGAGSRVLAQLALGFGTGFRLLAAGMLHPGGLTTPPMLTAEGYLQLQGPLP